MAPYTLCDAPRPNFMATIQGVTQTITRYTAIFRTRFIVFETPFFTICIILSRRALRLYYIGDLEMGGLTIEKPTLNAVYCELSTVNIAEPILN